MNEQTKKKTKNIFSIIGWIVVFLLFILSIICVIVRFSGSEYFIFGNRFDVVLTNSMATKNEKHMDFLKDYDNQIKAFDLVQSQKVEKGEDLKEGDIVVYTDRNIGTNMHRIVNVFEDTFEEITFNNSSLLLLDGNNGFYLEDVDSNITSNEISFDELEMITYSTKENQSDNFYFNVFSSNYIPTVTCEPFGNGFKYIYKIKRDTKAPGELAISHKDFYDYSQEIILSLKINTPRGIECSVNDFPPPNGGNITAKFNCEYKYETRGDAAETSDGLYSFSEIQGKVVTNYPGMGYIFRFLGSIWGGLMFVLLAILIIVVDMIATRMDKKEAAKAAAESAKKPEAVKPTPVPPVTPVPAPKPVEPVKKPEPVVNITVNTTTIKRDPNTGKEEVVKSSRVVQLKPGDNKTVSNTVNMTNAAPSAQPAKTAPQPAKPAQTAAKPTQNAAKPVVPAKPAAPVKPASPVKPNTSAKPAAPANKPAPAQVKPAAPSNGTVLRKSGNNVPSKGDKK